MKARWLTEIIKVREKSSEEPFESKGPSAERLMRPKEAEGRAFMRWRGYAAQRGAHCLHHHAQKAAGGRGPYIAGQPHDYARRAGGGSKGDGKGALASEAGLPLARALAQP